MADEKHESKRSCYSRHKWLPAAAAILLLVFLAAGFSFRYISFMSQTIYQESTSHLEEVLYKSNSMLKEMVRKNLTYLHLCNGFLKNTSNEDEIQAYIEEIRRCPAKPRCLRSSAPKRRAATGALPTMLLPSPIIMMLC